MNQSLTLKNRVIGIILTIAFILLFLNDHTVYSVFFDNYTSKFTIVSACLFVIAFLLVGKIYTNWKFWISFSLWIFCVTISCLLYGFNRMYFVRVVYWLVIVFSISSMYLAKIDFRNIFYNVARVFLIWALLNYVVNLLGLNIFPITATSTEQLYNWYNVDLYVFLFSKCYSHIYLGNISILRLDRPFGEPGIAQMYFNYAIVYLLFLSKQTKYKKVFWFIQGRL